MAPNCPFVSVNMTSDFGVEEGEEEDTIPGQLKELFCGVLYKDPTRLPRTYVSQER